jgi:hypothetical protein
MDNQEFVNTVYQYFIVEKHDRALNEEGLCVYRTETGGKCLVGCTLPDNLYEVDLEGNVISTLLNKFSTIKFPEIGAFYKDCNSQMMDRLQNFHDSYSGENFHEDLETELKKMCERYFLVYPGN